jgi:flagellar L-ring protein precursor FlgH
MKSISFLGLALLLGGCAGPPRHIMPYSPKARDFDPGEYAERPEPTPGSLYADQRGLFEDDRARRVGDLLVIEIDERETASRTSTTKLGRNSKNAFGAPQALGLMAKLKRNFPDIDPAQLLALSSDHTFKGNGQTQRSGRLTATLPVRVKEVMPNGDLFVEGTNVVMVSNEEHHLYVSGLVRQVDIQSNNTVPSSRIANAEIEYIGRGDVNDQQRPGWGSRALTRGAPF